MRDETAQRNPTTLPRDVPRDSREKSRRPSAVSRSRPTYAWITVDVPLSLCMGIDMWSKMLVDVETYVRCVYRDAA